jgi:hypothetical protein
MAVKKKLSVKNLSEGELIKVVHQLSLLDRDKPYKIYVLDAKKFRTTKLNRYYWGVVLDTVSKRTGYHVEELHEMFKAKFALRTRFSLDPDIMSVKHERAIIEEYPQSTKMMSNIQFMEYFEKIRTWFAEVFQEHIPLPNEMTEEQYIEAYDR